VQCKKQQYACCHSKYDTIRDDILTCAQKPTSQLDLPHGTKNYKVKKRKTNSKKTDIFRSIGKHPEIPGVSSKEEKEGCGKKDLQKRKVLSLG